MKRGITYVCFVLLICILCSSCGKVSFDTDKMAKSLSEENGEEYSVDVHDNKVSVIRTFTIPKSGRTRQDIASLSQKDFDSWVDGIVFLLQEETADFEQSFQKNGSDFAVFLTYRIITADEYELGTITAADGCSFTLNELSAYRVNTPEISSGLGNVTSPFDYSDQYILKKSSSDYLTFSDCKDLCKNDLQIAIDEIYARHGVIFDDSLAQKYFESKSWYNGTVQKSYFDENKLSDVEKENIAALRNYLKMP